jgi:hypothetical protein
MMEVDPQCSRNFIALIIVQVIVVRPVDAGFL